jgi:enoyl-CoA hydratase/carnithine racemase
MTETVVVTRDGAVQVLRLARPEKMNALTGAMYAALADAIEAGERDGTIAAHVICGAPGVFSAGNDLSDFLVTAKGSGGIGADGVRFIRLLPQIEKPLIAAVDGKAIGVGTTMLFHCDLVYATAQSIFATPFLDLGLVPEAASSLLMPRLMGHARAFEMLVLGEAFSAERAREAGFVNHIVAAADVESAAVAAAKKLAAKPPEALAMARRLLRGDTAVILERTDAELQLFKKRLASPEAREAFEAFFEKRPPKFRA